MHSSSNGSSLVVVTGASGGIGLELALCAARDGHEVLLVARGVEALEDAAERVRSAGSPAAHVLSADVATADGIDAIVQEVARLDLPLAALVNNAGFGGWGPVAAQDVDRLELMVDLNARSVATLTRRLLNRLVDARGGVLTVASTAAFQPGPGMAVYHATKAFALWFSVALRDEVRSVGVRVTALCPGPVPTNFADVAGIGDFDDLLLARMASQPAHKVARLGWKGLKRNRAIVVPGIVNRLGSLGARLVPLTVSARVARAAFGSIEGPKAPAS